MGMEEKIDRRKFNRGAKFVSGRKPKAEEQKLVEKLTPFEPMALAALERAVKSQEPWAIKLYFEYMYGKPKQVIDQNNTHTLNNFDIGSIVSFDKTKS